MDYLQDFNGTDEFLGRLSWFISVEGTSQEAAACEDLHGYNPQWFWNIKAQREVMRRRNPFYRRNTFFDGKLDGAMELPIYG